MKKSSITVSRGGRSITFRGAAARAAFEGMTGTKLPDPEKTKAVPAASTAPKPQLEAELAEIKQSAPRKMDPERFVVGERVQYRNHVMGYDIGTLVVQSLKGDCVTATRLFSTAETFKFTRDGIATWSPNLSIQHINEA